VADGGGITRLGNSIINFFAIEEGGRWTLLDAGVPGYWPQLAEHGIRPDAVEAVVLTHAHPDHVGLAERLRTSGARVYVHEDDENLATTAKPFGKNEKPLLPYLRYPMAWRLFTHLARNGGMKPQKIGEVSTFGDGEVLDVPGRPRAVHTPGHTSGHAVFHLEDRGALVVGDLLCTLNPLTGKRGPQLLPAALSLSSAHSLDSLTKIENLAVETVYLGHGEAWTDGVASAVERARSVGPT
jgi:glyoxylase-like metal-dependent hydrolase (beta-lactamase superfamily II)